MSQAKYIATRTAQTVITIFIVMSFIFVLFRLMPGDFTAQMVEAGASPEAVESIRDEWGLNDPIYVQYYNFLINYATLDPGVSPTTRQPVWDYVKMRILNTAILVGAGVITAYIFGAIIGTITGTRRGTKIEKWGIIPLIMVGAIPSFFTAILLIIVFASGLGWFPTSGISSPGGSGYDIWWRSYFTTEFLHYAALPFVAVVFRYLYVPSLIMRTSVVETMNKDFINYHRLTGMAKLDRMKQVAKHSSLPIITLFPVSMSRALGGLVLIETVFNWPGIGLLLVEAVLARDYPTVQFVFFIVAVFVIVSNYVVDIFYGVIDPRVTVED